MVFFYNEYSIYSKKQGEGFVEKITDKMLLDKAIAFCDELLSENGVKKVYIEYYRESFTISA